MSDERGEIHVTGFSVTPELPVRTCYGRGRMRAGLDPEPYTTVRLDLEMDRAGLARFLDLMEQVAPGFRREHAPRDPSLRETTRALPQGPIEAEFVDE